jgi:hypothetical protein
VRLEVALRAARRKIEIDEWVFSNLLKADILYGKNTKKDGST